MIIYFHPAQNRKGSPAWALVFGIEKESFASAVDLNADKDEEYSFIEGQTLRHMERNQWELCGHVCNVVLSPFDSTGKCSITSRNESSNFQFV